jgi:hypothetical protein
VGRRRKTDYVLKTERRRLAKKHGIQLATATPSQTCLGGKRFVLCHYKAVILADGLAIKSAASRKMGRVPARSRGSSCPLNGVKAEHLHLMGGDLMVPMSHFSVMHRAGRFGRFHLIFLSVGLSAFDLPVFASGKAHIVGHP